MIKAKIQVVVLCEVQGDTDKSAILIIASERIYITYVIYILSEEHPLLFIKSTFAWGNNVLLALANLRSMHSKPTYSCRV